MTWQICGNLKVSEVVKTLTLREPVEVSYDKTAFYNDYTSSTGNPNLPVALVFKDSFYYLLREKMSQHFDKMVCIGSYTFDYAKVDEVDPDLVIYEITERYIHLLVYLP